MTSAYKADHICHAQQQLQCSNPHSPCTPTCTTHQALSTPCTPTCDTHQALPTPCTAFHNSSMHTKTQGRVGKMAQDTGMVKVHYTCLFSFRKRFVIFYYTIKLWQQSACSAEVWLLLVSSPGLGTRLIYYRKPDNATGQSPVRTHAPGCCCVAV